MLASCGPLGAYGVLGGSLSELNDENRNSSSCMILVTFERGPGAAKNGR